MKGDLIGTCIFCGAPLYEGYRHYCRICKDGVIRSCECDEDLTPYPSCELCPCYEDLEEGYDYDEELEEEV